MLLLFRFQALKIFFFGYIWTSYGAPATRRHNPFCAYSFFYSFSGREADCRGLQTREMWIREREIENRLWAGRISFRLLTHSEAEIKMRNMCDWVVKLKFMRIVRRLRQVRAGKRQRNSFEVNAWLVLVLVELWMRVRQKWEGQLVT